MKLTDGLHPSVHRDAYDRVERCNFSTLKNMRLSPAHYRHSLSVPFEDTDAKKLGRAVHISVFEPERVKSAIAKWDGGTRRGKDWDRFREEHAGMELLTENEHEQMVAISAAVRANLTAVKYLSNGRSEVTLAWTHKVGEGANPILIPCKGRIDFDTSAIVDLKTTLNASPDGFGKEVWTRRYHTQAAWYVDGYERATGIRKPYYIVAVEKAAPHITQVYRVPDPVLALGREEYSKWMDQLAFCRETHNWPAYHHEELELTLPRWALGFEDGDGTDLSSELEASDGFDFVTPAN